MAASSDYNYDILLSLDKAKLVNRIRLNFLGSQEMVLDYNGITSVAREDCVEWLEANRLSITDPKFGFRTYEGTWFCVSITYNETKNSIRQEFRIDSSLKGDVTQRNAGGRTLKDYYWRVVNPAKYVIPEYKSVEGTGESLIDDLYWVDSGLTENGEKVYYDESDTYALWHTGTATNYKVSLIADIGGSPSDYYEAPALIATYVATGWTGAPVINTVESHGEEWTKTPNDNGDGTYDIIISSKRVVQLVGTGAIRVGAESGNQSASDSIFVTGSGDADTDGEYLFRYVDASGNPYWAKLSPASTGSPLSPDLNGVKWLLVENEMPNAQPAYVSEDGAYALWQKHSSGNKWLVTDFADLGGVLPSNRFELSVPYSSAPPAGTYTAYGTFSGALTIPTLASAKGIAYDANATRWEVINKGRATATQAFLYDFYLAALKELVPSPWYAVASGAIVPAMVAEIGRNGPAFTEDSTITVNSSEAKFTTEGGSVTEPVAGENISINNTPLSNGLFRTAISTKTMHPQRLPVLYGMFFYDSDDGTNGILHGKNQTQAKFAEDLGMLSAGASSLSPDLTANVNSVSVNINQSGLVDYTILSNTPKPE